MMRAKTGISIVLSLFMYSVMHQVSADETSGCKTIEVNHDRSCGVKAMHELVSIEAGECAELTIEAGSYWNASGLLLEKDANYEITVGAGEYWCDDNTRCSADGWRVDDEKFEACKPGTEVPELSGFKKWIFLKSEKYRRSPGADWFELVGVNGRGEETSQFAIGSGDSYGAERSGEFCAYANDLKWFYWNNDGTLAITVHRTE